MNEPKRWDKLQSYLGYSLQTALNDRPSLITFGEYQLQTALSDRPSLQREHPWLVDACDKHIEAWRAHTSQLWELFASKCVDEFQKKYQIPTDDRKFENLT